MLRNAYQVIYRSPISKPTYFCPKINASVESTLQDLRLLLKAPIFSKDQAFDYLLTLRLVAKETKHAKAGFYEAVLRAMREKSNVPDIQFKRYVEVLLGDKDQEKVLEMISKVDKSVRRGDAPNTVSRRVRSRPFRRPIQCYNCHQFGHYQSYCPLRQQGPRPKRAKFSSSPVDQSKN